VKKVADHKTDKLEAAELKTNSGKDAPAKEKKPGFFKRIGARFKKWFKELKSEAKKVSWPTFKQVVNNTIIVIVTVAVVGILIWVLDFLFLHGIKNLTSWLGGM
jgi:preprotein translocase subunit SecE